MRRLTGCPAPERNSPPGAALIRGAPAARRTGYSEQSGSSSPPPVAKDRDRRLRRARDRSPAPRRDKRSVPILLHSRGLLIVPHVSRAAGKALAAFSGAFGALDIVHTIDHKKECS